MITQSYIEIYTDNTDNTLHLTGETFNHGHYPRYDLVWPQHLDDEKNWT